MNAPIRKGWCPGALRPMMAKDGLLVRLRLTGGILSARKAIALADLAERFGNGLFDLSARGNLQMRGVRDLLLTRVQGELAALGLIDLDPDGEAVRNVLASPLAGLHEGPDIRSLVAALEHRLVSDSALHALPAKFGFVIDDGSSPSLSGIYADVRFDWRGDEFSIGLGGDAIRATRVGWCAASDLVEEAARIASRFIQLSAERPDIRRMRDLGDALRDALRPPPSPARGSEGREDIATSVSLEQEMKGARHLVGWHSSPSSRERTVSYLGLAAPFGRLDAAMLRQAATLAGTTPREELRLTPWRVIIVPDAPADAETPSGFITDPHDPRLAIAACVGIGGCAQGTTDTRADAAQLARDVACSSDGIALHVSGCAKGCAKATPSPLTLVARDGRYDLVRDGRAGDPPWRQGLDLDDVRELLISEPRAA